MASTSFDFSLLSDEQRSEVEKIHNLKIEDGYVEKKVLSFNAKCKVTVDAYIGVVTKADVQRLEITTKFADKVVERDLFEKKEYYINRRTDRTEMNTGSIQLSYPTGDVTFTPTLKPENISVGDWIVVTHISHNLRNEYWKKSTQINLSNQKSSKDSASLDRGWIKDRTTFTLLFFTLIALNLMDDVSLPLGQFVRDIATHPTAKYIVGDEVISNNILAFLLPVFCILVFIIGFVFSRINARRSRKMWDRIGEKSGLLADSVGLEKLAPLFPNVLKKSESKAV